MVVTSTCTELRLAGVKRISAHALLPAIPRPTNATIVAEVHKTSANCASAREMSTLAAIAEPQYCVTESKLREDECRSGYVQREIVLPIDPQSEGSNGGGRRVYACGKNVDRHRNQRRQ